MKPGGHTAALPILAALLCACGDTGSEPGGPGGSGAAGGPVGIVTASGVPMIALPGGEFLMGSDRGNADEAPVHRVRVSPFLMDKFEVTHALFRQAQLPNPSRWQNDANQPVERVRWRDAKQYCNERSLLENLTPCYDEKTADWDCDYTANGYRLPTEAEWEYACRAGSVGAYDFGTPDRLRQYAWFADNAGQQTHVVGMKKPNSWGLFDLYGNVSEWCEDVYDPAYYGASPAEDPVGPPNTGQDVRRVMRGGSWQASADMCRASYRRGERTGDSDACFYTDYCGFRCVRRATAAELDALPHAARP
ncbi:MAG: SUMF1/EgtB/PvdO family nonheme iron enzyme [Verrucomicrobiales bacterium]|nr:SUMF1/EgtB/PvdO family nonheme iron enzyme [Verrucomicrobiales bacterium]MCP5526407.1 SUMF1/EgtB/PvdO family nonheme iron enzyme [Verrucomicrobiales bacterium]